MGQSNSAFIEGWNIPLHPDTYDKIRETGRASIIANEVAWNQALGRMMCSMETKREAKYVLCTYKTSWLARAFATFVMFWVVVVVGALQGVAIGMSEPEIRMEHVFYRVVLILFLVYASYCYLIVFVDRAHALFTIEEYRAYGQGSIYQRYVFTRTSIIYLKEKTFISLLPCSISVFDF